MSEEHRTKIGKSKILNELIRFAEGQVTPEEYPPHRVTAALGLLKKVMPDMTETMVKGDADAPITFEGILLAPLIADDDETEH